MHDPASPPPTGEPPTSEEIAPVEPSEEPLLETGSRHQAWMLLMWTIVVFLGLCLGTVWMLSHTYKPRSFLMGMRAPDDPRQAEANYGMARDIVTRAETIHGYGNTPLAALLANHMRHSMDLSLRTVNYASWQILKADPRQGFSCFCYLTTNSCAFLVYSPQLFLLSETKKLRCLESAYLSGDQVIPKANLPPGSMVSLCLLDRYSHITQVITFTVVENYRVGPLHEVRTHPKTSDILHPFFAGEMVAVHEDDSDVSP